MPVFASIMDLQVEARRRVPKPFYEYVQNGAFTQTTMNANRDDLDLVKFRQHMLGNPSAKSLASTMLGQKVSVPLALAPVGMCGMNRARGEILAARAARRFGVPFILSTFSIASIEDVAAEAGGGFWFQLYPMRDMKLNESLMSRAAKVGVETLVVTIDSQIEGTRYRDEHNGVGVPPKLTPGNVWSIVSHPRWALGMLRSPRYTFGNMVGETDAKDLGELAKVVKASLLPSIDLDFLKAIRARWKGGLVIKGILSEADARIALEAGADAIVVSNHGGRSLEGALSTAAVFPRIRDLVPDHVELYVDSGIRTGIDVLRFLGMGARACLVGRAYIYGLGAAGESGVMTALKILSDELERVMGMTGVSDLSMVSRSIIAEQASPLVFGQGD